MVAPTGLIYFTGDLAPLTGVAASLTFLAGLRGIVPL